MPAVRNCEGVVLPSGVRSLHGRMVMAMLLSRCTDNAVIDIAPHVCDNPIAICTEIRYINQAQILGRGEVSGQTAGGLIHFYQKPGSTGFR